MSSVRTGMSSTADEWPAPRFWSRQFYYPATRNQNIFDLVFGLVLPIISFVADPIVFRAAGFYGEVIFVERQLFAYSGAAIAISTLSLWLWRGSRLSAKLCAALAGVMAAASVAALIVGILLLPFSIYFLFASISDLSFTAEVLGLAPIFMGFVCGRNAYRAYRSAGHSDPGLRRWKPMSLGFLLAIGLPTQLQSHQSTTVSAALASMKSAEQVEREAAASRLIDYPLCLSYCTVALYDAYRATTDEGERAALSSAHEAFTGESIETRIQREKRFTDL